MAKTFLNLIKTYTHTWTSLVAQMVKNPPAMQEIQVQSLGQEDPLERACLRIYIPGEPRR